MYKNVLLDSTAAIYTKNKQLCIENKEIHTFPIEDLNSLVLGSRDTKITSYCLDALVSNGTSVIVCNGQHQPSGVLIPFGAYCRRLPMIKLQFYQTKPQLKKMWQQIIKQKISNQLACLKLLGLTSNLDSLVGRVKSGDTDNVESYAAAMYFKTLFGEGFVRSDDENPTNGLLNYGYAIIRACIARCLAAYGMEPSLGIFHHSEQNSFNLADDIIEPFRPIVDLVAYQLRKKQQEELTPTIKSKFVEILNCDVLISEQRQPVNYAIEQVIQNLIRCYRGEKKTLCLPTLLPLKIHCYE